MCNKLMYLNLILVLALTGGLAVADPFQQDPGPDGIVSMEAENFDENTPRPPHTWELITESASGFLPPGGFSGGFAMQSTPTTPAGGSGFNDPADFLAKSPRLDYEVNFVKTGTHYVWVLAWGLDGNSDSIHSGLDGQHVATADRIGGFNNNYTWTNTAYQDPERIMFEVTSTGVHTVNIWMREDGSVVDKILLTTNPNYTPTGSGPPESWRGPRFKAYNPVPADGTVHPETWVSLSWSPGDFAVSHDVYLGENFDDVNEGISDTFRSNESSPYIVAGFPGYPYPDGLVPGTTYFWRIDEVNETETDSPWKGDVWSFSIPPKKAYSPVPIDSARFINPDNPNLSWSAGFGAKLHTMYIGDDLDTVADATVGTPVGTTTYRPGQLEPGTTYYWRVDEFDAAATHKGDIWSFTTAKIGGGVKGQYFRGMDFNTLVLTRTDPQINFNWAANEPDPAVGADLFSVKWAGEIEAAFTETYTFYTRSDDGVRLWVDGQKLVDNWTDHSATENSGKIDLVAGNTYSFQMEYYENTGDAVAELRWSSPSTPKQLVPQAAFSPPISASGPNPGNGATGTSLTPALTWNPGDFAVSHEVYFGTDADAVRNAAKSSPEYKGTKTLGEESYSPGKLAWATVYYWRVDEVNDAHPDSPWAGNVWSFTTGDFLLIDDFEDYNADENQIWYTWHDGLGYGTQGTANYFAGNGTGAAVGDETTASYTEETIVHGGSQSMPLAYDNDKQGYAKYSEAEMTLTAPRDWTEEGVGELSLWFHGRPASVGSFVEGPVGTYTMTATGTDIWNNADEFHFAFKTLAGPGSIVAKVLSVENTNVWAKAGVMIRETLEPGSKFAAVYITPGNGCRFQARTDTEIAATSDTSVATAEQIAITAPCWVKLERDVAGNFRGYYSSDGATWRQMSWNPRNISMGSNVHVGLGLTSHDAALTCEAKFSNVTITGTTGAQWMNQDIGIVSNSAEPLYVALSNSTGTAAVVYHDEPAAATIDTWTEWVIPLQAFADQGINLTNVDRIAVGMGTKGNMTVPGGSGKVYFDDIRLYRTRNDDE